MKRILSWSLIGVLGVLVWFSFYLAANRIYQVDECMELYIARMVATGQAITHAGFVTLFQVILSCFVHGNFDSAGLYTAARFVMAEIFWLNIVLIAVGTGEKLFSGRGLAALLGAATLAPLWDYGFEIRHDNLLLTGLLLMWVLLRIRPPGLQSYFIMGAAVVGLQFLAFKAFIYTIPLSLAGLIFPPPRQKISRTKSAAALVIGGLLAYATLRVLFDELGLWQLYLNGSQALSDVSMSGYRFGPGLALNRLLWQTPLLLALTTSGLLAVAVSLKRDWRTTFSWNGNLPEALLFLVSLAALLINPVPYPYNLLHLVPFAFLLAFRHAMDLWQEIRTRPVLVPIGITVLFFTHFMPFEIATIRHLNWSNGRQIGLMTLAERLTDPIKNKIYDGVGLVVTRPMNPRWFLHSFSYVDKSGPKLRKLLTVQPATVIIPNYRTDWLSDKDHAFIRERYVPMADDFWVLGHVLPAGGGEFKIYQKGRYRISSLKGSDIEGTYPTGYAGFMTPLVKGEITGTLDGKPLSTQQVELNVGAHYLRCPTNIQPAVVWIGPHMNRIGRVGVGNHDKLFVNWY
jgi:hypothetical protein